MQLNPGVINVCTRFQGLILELPELALNFLTPALQFFGRPPLVVKAPWCSLSRCLQGFGQLFRHRLEIMQGGSLVVRHRDRLATERTIHRQSRPLLIDYELASTMWAF